jgi:AcrR family transcriptional regulator
VSPEPDRPGGGGGIRRQRALQTRRRMVRAAYDLFCERGYAATTMTDIAAASQVAVQTLYFTFRTKGALLGEALGAAVVGFDSWTGPPAEPPDTDTLTGLLGWYGDFEAAPDARRALDVFVGNGVAILRRVAPLHAAVIAAGADPEAAAVIELAERRRADTFRRVAAGLAARGALRRGVDEARATDLLVVLFSPEVYHALTAGRGWSHPACRAFLLDVLAQQLLPPDADRPQSPPRQRR